MTHPANISTESRYFVYLGSGWTGPLTLAEVRTRLAGGQLAADTYAYAPDEQRHYTVGELLAESTVDAFPIEEPAVATATRASSRLSIVDLDEDAPAQATLSVSAAFEDALPELRDLFRACIDLSENRAEDTGTALAALRRARFATQARLRGAVSDLAARRSFANDLGRIGDYLANRRQDARLWDLLAALREGDLGDAPATLSAIDAVLDHLVVEAERHAAAAVPPPAIAAAARGGEHDDYGTTRRVLAGTQGELGAAQRDLEAVQRAYEAMREQHARELAEARSLLSRAEASRGDLASAAAQSEAEVRSLAAEVHRLADEVAQAGADPELMREVARLGVELHHSDATTIAPLAEGVLIRMVARLRSLAEAGAGGGVPAPAEIARLREEVAQVRSELVQARAQAMATADERDHLRRELEEQRQAAERAAQAMRGRELRLHAAAAALDGAGQVHQVVVSDLEDELAEEQQRVAGLERELEEVRSGIRSGRSGIEERTQELQEGLRRLVEMRATLEGRRQELLAAVQATENEISGLGAEEDDSELLERARRQREMAAAAERRLRTETEEAERLERELAASRAEASRLRERSEALARDLEQGRASLAEARRRCEELRRVHQRLEAERQRLQAELARPGTAPLDRGGQPAEQRLAEANRRIESLSIQLEDERASATALAEQHRGMSVRVDELAADRDHLRQELDRLHAEHFAEHSRHAAQIAMATQATIDAEHRYKEAMEQVFHLEERLADLEDPGEEAPLAALEPKDPETQARTQERGATLRIQLTEARERQERAERALAEARERSQRIAREESAADGGQAGRIADRLAASERELAQATAARDALQTRLADSIGERDRLARELARLRNEHEAAAVEHRTALKSARDRLGEAQQRVQELERELESQRAGGDGRHGGETPADRLALEARLAEALVEQERHAADAHRLAVELERTQARLEAARLGQTGDLAEAARRLAGEQEQVAALNRSLAEARRAAEEAAGRAAAAEARTAEALAGRDRLQAEAQRLRGEAAAAASPGDSRIEAVLADRERLIAELEAAGGELADLRRRLARAERAALLDIQASSGRARLLGLEEELAEARRAAAEARSGAEALRQEIEALRAERDRLVAEVGRLQAAAAESADLRSQLAALRQRLLRARARIRVLRAERDRARSAHEEASHASLTLATRLRRLQEGDAQAAPGSGALARASAEGRATTLRAGPPAQPPAEDDGSGGRQIGGESAAAIPAIPGTAALTRRTLAGTAAMARGEGFTSAFGRPSIAVLPGMGSGSGTAIAHTAALSPRSRFVPWRHILRPRVVAPVAALAAAAALVGAALGAAPYSAQAWVNARLVQIRTPIDGQVEAIAQRPGAMTVRDQALVEMRNPDPPRGELDALLSQRALIAAKRAAAERDLGRLPAAGADPAAPPTEAAVLLLREREQQRSQIQERIDALEAEDAAVAGRIAAAEQRLEHLRARTLASPVDGLVLRHLLAPGRWARAGESVATVADRSTVAVQAVFPPSAIDRIHLGDRAEVSLPGQERRWEAIVAAIDPLAAGDDADFAVRAPPAGGDRIRVTLALPAGVDLAAQVGGGARVVVRDGGPLAGLGAWLRRVLSP